MRYQVVIVGAGIAGLTAGLECARLGLKVVILEKEKDIGYPLSCAEYVPTPDELCKMFPRVDNFKQLLSYPDEFIRHKCTKARVHGSFQRYWEFNISAIVLNRPRLEQYLAEQCVSEGVTIHKGVKVRSFQPDGSLTFDSGGTPKISGAICVAADGPASRIARNAGLAVPHIPYQLSPCLGYIITDVELDPEVTHAFFNPKYAPGGYAWIIPRGESQVNVGLGVRQSFMQNHQKLSVCLNRFLKQQHSILTRRKYLKKTVHIRGLVPVGGPIPVTYTTNLMVIGDAAGFVMACNGGGIPTGVLSGYLAAQAAEKYFAEARSLSFYEKTWKDQMGAVLKTTVDIRKMMYKIMSNDSLMERLMDFVGSRRVGEMLKGNIPLLIRLGYPLIRAFL